MMSPTKEASICIEIDEVDQPFVAHRADKTMRMPQFVGTGTRGADAEVAQTLKALKLTQIISEILLKLFKVQPKTLMRLFRLMNKTKSWSTTAKTHTNMTQNETIINKFDTKMAQK